MDSLFTNDDTIYCGYVDAADDEIINVAPQRFEDIIARGEDFCWQLQRPTHGPLKDKVVVSDELGSVYYIAIANEVTDREAITRLVATMKK